MSNRIQIRRGSASDWENTNIVLSLGELGFDFTNSILKIGDGISLWNVLPEFKDNSALNLHIDDTEIHFTQSSISITESQISDFGNYEPADATILKSADIGTTVQGYNANTVIDANYETFDSSGTYANLRAQSTTAGDVGLGNVTNESKETMFTDAALTGVPTAPTASLTTNNTQIATTEFVISELDTFALGLNRSFAVEDITARDNLTGLNIGDFVFVADNGDEKWAQYKLINDDPKTFVKIMDQDIMLNALNAPDIKAAYESNADTNAFTDSEKTNLTNLINVTHAIATKEEAESGAVNNKYMTPQRVLEAIEANSASVVISSTAPLNPDEGNLWFDSSNLLLFIYFNDGESLQWIEVVGGLSVFAEVKYYTLNINTNEWPDTEPSVLEVTVPGILASDRPIIDLDLKNVPFEDIDNIESQYGLIYLVEATDEDEITFTSRAPLEESINITIQVVR